MSNSKVTVSVVIPTHQRRELLARLLRSLEQQSLGCDRYEVVIVHDYTADGTEEMARAWCSRQPFSARYYRKSYRSAARIREFGVAEARGSIVGFIDDDCVATPQWLEAGVAAFRTARDSGCRPDGEPPRGIGLVQGRTLPMPCEPRGFCTKTLRIEAPTVFFETCNIFYSKEAFAAAGGFSADFTIYGEDTDLGWKVTQLGYESAFVPAALVYHEVFRLSIAKWLTEPWYFRHLPRLVAMYPQLRRSMYRRYFVSRDTCLFNFLLIALGVGCFNGPLGIALAAPYLYQRYAGGAHVGGLLPRLARVVAGVPRGLVVWLALVTGSLRARALLI